MRLINTLTCEIREFFEAEIDEYIILSHRWARQEVTMKEFVQNAKSAWTGHQKILKFCRVAFQDKCTWAWVDTICIDKRSSAELSEAINSMYAWYSKAKVCYAYLSDVNIRAANGNPDKLLVSVLRSQWFDRGWTLQELLAPQQVIFFADDWSVIGQKRGEATYPGTLILRTEDLQHGISRKTGIPIEALQDPRSIRRFSAAQRMSWAAYRKTTRVEDRAYCMLGLFGVNMSLLYGEGERAFRRLQLEIIKASHPP